MRVTSMWGLAALVAWATVGAASADALKTPKYECSFEQSEARGGGWIPEKLYIFEDATTGEALIIDNVINHFVGEPIPVRRTSSTKVRTTYTWDVEARVGSQAPRMRYTLSYFVNGQPARMSAQPGSYDNVWTGEGKCVVTKG